MALNLADLPESEFTRLKQVIERLNDGQMVYTLRCGCLVKISQGGSYLTISCRELVRCKSCTLQHLPCDRYSDA